MSFPGEFCTAGAHHVEQNTETGFITRFVGALGPELGAQAPGLCCIRVLSHDGPSRWRFSLVAEVFSVETNKINAEIHRILLQHPGDFEHYPYPAGAVV